MTCLALIVNFVLVQRLDGLKTLRNIKRYYWFLTAPAI